jgi:hypothetical protein
VDRKPAFRHKGEEPAIRLEDNVGAPPELKAQLHERTRVKELAEVAINRVPLPGASAVLGAQDPRSGKAIAGGNVTIAVAPVQLQANRIYKSRLLLLGVAQRVEWHSCGSAVTNLGEQGN